MLATMEPRLLDVSENTSTESRERWVNQEIDVCHLIHRNCRTRRARSCGAGRRSCGGLWTAQRSMRRAPLTTCSGRPRRRHIAPLQVSSPLKVARVCAPCLIKVVGPAVNWQLIDQSTRAPFALGPLLEAAPNTQRPQPSASWVTHLGHPGVTCCDAGRARAPAAAAASAPTAPPTAAPPSPGLAFDPATTPGVATLAPAPSAEAAGFAAAQRSRPNGVPLSGATPAAPQPQATRPDATPPGPSMQHAAAVAARPEQQASAQQAAAAGGAAQQSPSAANMMPASSAKADPIADLQQAQAAASASRGAGQGADQARNSALAGTSLRADAGGSAADEPAARTGAAVAAADMAMGAGSASEPATVAAAATAEARQPEPRRKLRQRRVPSSQIGRVMGFAGLGARLAAGTLGDSISNMFRCPHLFLKGCSVQGEIRHIRLVLVN